MHQRLYTERAYITSVSVGWLPDSLNSARALNHQAWSPALLHEIRPLLIYLRQINHKPWPFIRVYHKSSLIYLACSYTRVVVVGRISSIQKFFDRRRCVGGKGILEIFTPVALLCRCCWGRPPFCSALLSKIFARFQRPGVLLFIVSPFELSFLYSGKLLGKEERWLYDSLSSSFLDVIMKYRVVKKVIPQSSRICITLKK